MSRLSYFGYFHPILYFLRVYILSQSVINQSLQKLKGSFLYLGIFTGDQVTGSTSAGGNSSKSERPHKVKVHQSIAPENTGQSGNFRPVVGRLRVRPRIIDLKRWLNLEKIKGFDCFQSLFIMFYRHAALWLCSRMLQAFDCVLHFFTRSGL